MRRLRIAVVALLPFLVAATPPPVSSPFGSWTGAGGARRWQHYGIDIPVPIGTPVLAAADGRVARVTDGPLSGLKVVLVHREGEEPVATTYHHLSSIDVKVGDRVARGSRIGLSGMTGHASAPHLHFGLCRRAEGRCGDRIDEGWADPAPWFLPSDRVCFDAERPASARAPAPAGPLALSYPVPCR